MEKTKKKPWFLTKIQALEKELELLNGQNNQNSQNGVSQQVNKNELNIDSYCKGFYDCMSKYAIFSKGARRRIVQTIKERYKNNNDTKFVWKVK